MGKPPTPSLALSPAASGLLLLSLILTVLQAIFKPAWVDELLEFYTDTQPSFAALLHLQRTAPFSLEPASFHLLLHGLEQIFGRSLFVERLPAIVFSLVAQCCLFWMVRVLSGERAALCAMLLPTVTYSRHYFAEGRVYGFSFGLSALALLSWVVAASGGVRRFGALLVLTLSGALLVTSHYYGVLLLAPLFVAEGVRTGVRRRFDWAMWLGLGTGSAAALLDLPFLPAALLYRGHYLAQAADWHTIPNTYAWLFAVTRLQGRLPLALVVLALVGGALFLRSGERAESKLRADSLRSSLLPLKAAAVLLLLLPFAGYLVARQTRAFEPRYVLPALLGFAIVSASALAPALRNRRFFITVLSLLILLSAASGVREIYRFQRERKSLLASFAVPAAWQGEGGAPRETIYLKSVESFLLVQYYRPGPYADRFTLVYSPEVELRRMNYDAPARIAEGISRAWPQFHVLAYEQMRGLPGVKLVNRIPQEGAADWLQPEMIDDAYKLRSEGEFLQGNLALAVPPNTR